MNNEYINVKFSPCGIIGNVRVPSSKSISHRAMICAALADGVSNLHGIDASDDMTATVGALRAIGCKVEVNGTTVTVSGRNPSVNNECVINCLESASTLRFLIPIVAALGIPAAMTGEGRLPERPVVLYRDLFEQKGVKIELKNNGLPLTMRGRLSAGKFYIPGDISSQFVSGLLFGLPLLDGDSEIILTSPLESAPYADLTINALNTFGIDIQKVTNGYTIYGNQKYKSKDCYIEGDFSQAAFFACAGAINGDVSIDGLNPNTIQGDSALVELLNRFGAKCYFGGKTLRSTKGILRAIDIDALHIPDLIPVLSVVAAYAEGTTVIRNAQRLRLKESDRLRAVCDMLTSVGADAKETDDGLIIKGKDTLTGGAVKSCGDHRIAMSAAVASVRAENGVTVDNMHCINKSYPAFLRDFTNLIIKQD